MGVGAIKPETQATDGAMQQTGRAHAPSSSIKPENAKARF